MGSEKKQVWKFLNKTKRLKEEQKFFLKDEIELEVNADFHRWALDIFGNVGCGHDFRALGKIHFCKNGSSMDH